MVRRVEARWSVGVHRGEVARCGRGDLYDEVGEGRGRRYRLGRLASACRDAALRPRVSTAGARSGARSARYGRRALPRDRPLEGAIVPDLTRTVVGVWRLAFGVWREKKGVERVERGGESERGGEGRRRAMRDAKSNSADEVPGIGE